MKRYIIALFAALCCLSAFAGKKKAVYIIIDGVPADQIERLHTPAIFDIASKGGYARAYTGGEPGAYTETPTISAVGYTNLLTATWFNKHNVGGNDNLSPNYNYWTIFRIAKEQKKPFTTGLFSSWTDNRTVLIGEGKPETGNLKIDYVADGFDHDAVNYPHKDLELHVFDYDEAATKAAAETIRRDAPDLSWVYLWYTDDAGHIKGNGEFFDEYVRKADDQVAAIWEAVKYRQKEHGEDWMVVVTTDHGRGDDGHNHGGQSERERTTWISTNVPVNGHFGDANLAITDIAPSISRYLGFEVPRDVLWEQDGIPFIGKTDICDLKARRYDNTIALSWRAYKPSQADIYVAVTNEFNKGGKDDYIKIATVPAGTTDYIIDPSALPESDFYKFVVVTPNNHINRWYKK